MIPINRNFVTLRIYNFLSYLSYVYPDGSG